jgi:hypothetical protein
VSTASLAPHPDPDDAALKNHGRLLVRRRPDVHRTVRHDRIRVEHVEDLGLRLQPNSPYLEPLRQTQVELVDPIMELGVANHLIIGDWRFDHLSAGLWPYHAASALACGKGGECVVDLVQ